MLLWIVLFFIYFSGILWLLYRNSTNFWMPVLCLATVLNLLINSNNVLRESLGFSTHNIISSANKDFTSSFLIWRPEFFTWLLRLGSPLPRWTGVARVLVPGVREKADITHRWVWCQLWVCPLWPWCWGVHVSFLLNLLRVFFFKSWKDIHPERGACALESLVVWVWSPGHSPWPLFGNPGGSKTVSL